MTISLAVNCRFLSQRLTGVQRAAIELSKQIKLLDPSVAFLAPKNILYKDLAENLNVTTIGNLTGHLWEQFELPTFLTKQGLPLLLNLCNTAPLRYPRYVVTIHDLAPIRNPAWYSLPFRTYYRFMTPIIAKKALKVITDSSFSKQEIMELLHIPENHIKVIPLAVPANISRLAHKRLTYENGKYVLAVSSIDPRKNFARLIKAFARANLHDVKLILVGSKNRVFSHQKLENTSQNVHFKGYLPDDELVTLYQHALCLIYPSLYEGFGLPPLEAMACGCPVIVSKTASLPEICGDAAYYVDPYDVDSIAEGIYKVATDEHLRKTLIDKQTKRVAMFSWEKSAQEMLKVIKEVSVC